MSETRQTGATAEATAAAHAVTTPPPPLPRGGTQDWPIEIRALLTAMQRPVRRPRHPRKHERHPLLFEAILRYKDPHRGDQQLFVHTRDRSDVCVGFLTNAYLEAGQLVDLDFTHRPASASIGRIVGRIRRCRQFREGWCDCVLQVGETARKPLTFWQRAMHWLGEATGFGPDDRRGHAQPKRGRAA